MAKTKKAEEKAWQDFIDLCSEFISHVEMNKFFSLFLTIEERHLLSSRYLIIKALLDGKLTQREIAEKYNVSIAQITRGSNALKIIGPRMKKLLKEHFATLIMEEQN